MDMDIEEIYREYGNKVKAYIRSRVNNPSDAEDLASEVFLKVQKKMADYTKEKGAVSTWIYTIAHNTVIDFYRANKVMESIDEEREGELTPSQLISEDNADSDLLNKETLSELAEAMDELSDEEKMVIVYRYYDGLSLREIADKTGLSYGQAKLRHGSALKTMKKFFLKKAAGGRFTTYQ